MSTPFPARIGRYDIVDRLGIGGMGVVYLATDPLLRRTVAIKMLQGGDDELRERFAREARSAAGLRHNNIVTIYDVGEDEGRPFIAMEFVDGESMAELIRRRAPLSLPRRLELMGELCAGLGYAHRNGIVHRDIKPANLMITTEGSLKILDFGLARMATDATSAGLTRAGALMGTPQYMAPEQIEGMPADQASDIFAVGLVLYELLAYRRAFPGESAQAVLIAIVSKPPTPIREYVPDLDPELERVVERAVEKERDKRFPNLRALGSVLDQLRARFGTGDDGVTLYRDRDRGRLTTPAAGTPISGTSGGDAIKPSIPNLNVIAERRAAQIEQHVKAAQAHFDAGRYEAAIEQCENAVVLNPDEPRALSLLQQAHRALEDRQIDGWLQEARDCVSKGALSAADGLIVKSLQLRSAQPDALTLQQQVRALRREQELAAERKRAVRTAIERALRYMEDGAFEAASRSASEALAFDPQNEEARALKARATAILDEQRRAREHEEAAERAVNWARQLADAESLDEAAAVLRAFQPPHPAVDEFRTVVEAAIVARDRRRQEEEERRRREEEEARQREEARRREEEARRQREEEERRKREEDERRRREEEARRKREEDERRRREEEEARKRAEAEAKRKREEDEARKRAEAEARRKREEEEARQRAEAEAKRKREEEEARQRAEAEAKRKREEDDARKRAEAEARRKREEEEARQRAEVEAKRKREEDEARKRAEAEARRKREEEEARQRAEAKRKREEEEARKRAEAEARRKREEEEARQRTEAEAKRKREEEEARRRAEAEAKRRREEEARQRAEEERRRRTDREGAQPPAPRPAATEDAWRPAPAAVTPAGEPAAVALGPLASGTAVETRPSTETVALWQQKPVLAAVAAGLVLVVALTAWLTTRGSTPASPDAGTPSSTNVDLARTIEDARGRYQRGDVAGAIATALTVPAGTPERSNAEALLQEIRREAASMTAADRRGAETAGQTAQSAFAEASRAQQDADALTNPTDTQRAVELYQNASGLFRQAASAGWTVQQFVAEATQELQAQRIPRAIELALQAIEREPRNRDALGVLGAIRTAAAAETDAAARQARNAGASEVNSPSFKQARTRDQAARRLTAPRDTANAVGAFAEARDAYARAVTEATDAAAAGAAATARNRQAIQTAWQTAESRLKAGDLSGAASALDQAAKLDPSNPRLGEMRGTLESLRVAQANEQQRSLDIPRIIGEAAKIANDNVALQQLRSGLTKYPGNTELTDAIGRRVKARDDRISELVKRAQGAPDQQALALLDEAIALDPNRSDVRAERERRGAGGARLRAESEVRKTLAAYEAAYEARNASDFLRVASYWTPELVAKEFRSFSSIELDIANPQLRIDDDGAGATVNATITIVREPAGVRARPITDTRPWDLRLENSGGSWRITSATRR